MGRKSFFLAIAVLLLASCGGKKDEGAKPLFLEYSSENLSVYKEVEDTYYIKGEVKASDYVDSTMIEKGMSVKGGDFLITWDHSKDGKNHSFNIHMIPAASRPYKVQITLNYPKYDAAAPSKIEYDIPPKGKFIVVAQEVFLEPYHFEITFSSSLDKKQSFKELVSVPQGGKLKFLAESNKLKIYPSNRKKGTQTVTISKAFKNLKGNNLETDWENDFTIPAETPSVKFITKGTLLPSTNGMKLYFQSINYAKAQVRVRQIFENNILQYLQSYNLNSSNVYNIDDVSKIVADTTFALDEPSSPKLMNVTSYGLDISSIIKPQKGALYKVEIRGREKLVEDSREMWESDYYFGSYSDYEQRTVNILATDLAVIAKGSDNGEFVFYVTNILTAKPVSGAKVKVYDRVNQLIGEGSTSSDGQFLIKYTDYKPFTAVISKGNDRTYVKMEEGLSLSLSNFDVDGAAVRSGQKGFIFGERGVWRPGDHIYLTFISMLSEGVLPQGHPVTAVLKNPHDQVVQTLVNSKGFNGMYAFDFKTADDAPTGNWQVDITAGGQTYTKILKIETVKPNRLKIDFSVEDSPIISADNINGKLEASWLAGNPGKNLKTTVYATLTMGKTVFHDYKDYVFEDLSRSFSSGEYTLASGKTDENGFYSFSTYFPDPTIFPGFMNIHFEETVYEPSGDFSVDNFSATLSPYKKYVGLYIPEQTNDWGGRYLDIEKKHTFKLVTVNKKGSPISTSKLEVEVYKMGWNWWWGSSSSESLAMYSRDSYNKPYKILNVPLKGGAGSFELGFDKEEPGYYFFRVSDSSGGHSASAAVLVQNNYSSELTAGADGAARLQTSLDKGKYSIGETAQLTIPSSAGAQALVCLEKGDKLLRSFWVPCTSEKTVIPIPLNGAMAPNIYASVTLVQPHNTAANDAPIRMFGVQRICVEDPATHLYPVIKMAEEVRPESELEISVSERDGRPMSYVIALVDEGLLGLTRYKTPNPWNSFYATEALGIRTWDVYDMVIGAYGAKMERLFAIGGGDDASMEPTQSKAQRFKPVSLFLGPYTLSRDRSASHFVKIPPYIGSLRVMVIATDGRAQGAKDKNVTVTKPLMVQATLPRVLGTEEEVVVPVTVFAMKEKLGQISVLLETNDAFTISGKTTQSISVSEIGEQMVYFKLKTPSAQALGRLKVSASCESDKASESLEIDVRDPNPAVSVSKMVLLSAGEKSKFDFPLPGRLGTNSAVVEASTLPAVDLDYRLGYLSAYEHSCLEQSVSCAFPLLYVSDLTDVPLEKASEYENRVKASLARISAFATSSGGMTYWPLADSGVSFWGTTYAVHFMICAQAQGYAVPASVLKSALSYIRTRAARKDDSSLERAYACYVLSLSEEAPLGAMNRLREGISSVNAAARWYLAAAYAANGKKDVSREIVSGISNGSGEDMELSTAVQVYLKLGEKAKAFEAVRQLSEIMNDRDKWMSAQGIAYGLNSVAAYAASIGESAEGSGGGVDAAVSVGKAKYELKGVKGYVSTPVEVHGEMSLPFEIVNHSSAQTYMVVSAKGVPEKRSEKEYSNGLDMTVEYYSMSGAAIDPTSLEQGTDFRIRVSVTNTNPLKDYTNLVLTHIFPSGWEYRPDRQVANYQDFRDNRTYTYFDLPRGASIAFTTRATATYSGKFYLPAVNCESMNNGDINASVAGRWCEVR